MVFYPQQRRMLLSGPYVAATCLPLICRAVLCRSIWNSLPKCPVGPVLLLGFGSTGNRKLS